ncbi:hypothetical protein PV417_26315 [Streptomyces sp. ME19-03-3]|nr:hypothetical protein [Streptomyces sp. ME19-03-3]
MITTDALHTRHGHGSHLTGRGAHYLAVVKENQPGLWDGRAAPVPPWCYASDGGVIRARRLL